jgi:tetratricopeptide (TPR) repeat protein
MWHDKPLQMRFNQPHPLTSRRAKPSNRWTEELPPSRIGRSVMRLRFEFLIFAVLFSGGWAFAAEPVTFSKDIAPIIWKDCAVCHRPGQAAPFSLLSYNEVKKHGRQIAKAIAENYMPPWPPEAGYGHFQNERRLSVEEKKLIQAWVEEGSPDGDPKQLPPQPIWKDGWMLGKPDLVVTMPKPFALEAEGPDLYRNFVIPIEMDRDRYVRAVEFAPGNPAIVHHAFIKVDTNGVSRRLEGRELNPGFPGMNTPAEMPAGQFLNWQPGKLPAPAPDNLAWLLTKKSDLVLQLHLNRTGKPETLQSSVGLYFTDKPPTNQAFKFAFVSLKLHFPPGTSNNVVTNSFTLPVPVKALAILPHAHNLARDIQAYATRPDGAKEWLLWTKDWDFRWQGDYRYAEPINLPAGTKLESRFVYDNSTNNLRNPNNPPKLVEYGAQTTDEMSEIWLQLLPENAVDLAKLGEAVEEYTRQQFRDYYRARLEWNPDDAVALTRLGTILMMEGKYPRAIENFRLALRINPDLADAHYELGVYYRLTKRLAQSKGELETAVRLDPQNPKAWGHLGFLAAEMGDDREAERCLRKSFEIDPGNKDIEGGLKELAVRLGR